MKKKILLLIIISLILMGCKSLYNSSVKGNFKIVNKSEKVIEFIWIAPEGNFYPTAQNIDIGKDEVFETEGLEPGAYDIAIDFKGEFNSFNSKKDKDLCLLVEKGQTQIWIIDPSGNIIK